MSERPSAAGVIVAGGMSRRMAGRDKLALCVAGTPLAQRVADALAQVTDELILALRADQPPPAIKVALPLLVVRDPAPDLGPLAGLLAALATRAARWYLAVAADMPLLQPPLLAHLLDTARLQDAHAVVPLRRGEPEPLCAVYRDDCLDVMLAEANAGRRSLREVLTRLNVRFVPESDLRRFDPGLLSLFNVNRPQDLARAEELLAAGRR